MRKKQEAGSRKPRADGVELDAGGGELEAGSRELDASGWRHVYVAHDVMLNLNGARDTTVWRIQEKVFYTDAESRVIRYPALRKVPPQGR